VNGLCHGISCVFRQKKGFGVTLERNEENLDQFHANWPKCTVSSSSSSLLVGFNILSIQLSIFSVPKHDCCRWFCMKEQPT